MAGLVRERDRAEREPSRRVVFLNDSDIDSNAALAALGCRQDMAAAAVYLASRAGDYVVGTTLAVDGGVTWNR